MSRCFAGGVFSTTPEQSGFAHLPRVGELFFFSSLARGGEEREGSEARTSQGMMGFDPTATCDVDKPHHETERCEVAEPSWRVCPSNNHLGKNFSCVSNLFFLDAALESSKSAVRDSFVQFSLDSCKNLFFLSIRSMYRSVRSAL